MTLQEYANRLGISYSTAHKRFKAGKIPGAYLNKYRKIEVPDGLRERKPLTIKLSQYATEQGISYKTAWRLFKAGNIPGAFRLGGKTILVPVSIDCSERVVPTTVTENNAMAMINWERLTLQILLNRYEKTVACVKLEQIKVLMGYHLSVS